MDWTPKVGDRVRFNQTRMISLVGPELAETVYNMHGVIIRIDTVDYLKVRWGNGVISNTTKRAIEKTSK